MKTIWIRSFIVIVLMFSALSAWGEEVDTGRSFPASGVHTVRIAQREGLVQVTGLQHVDTITINVVNHKGGAKCLTDVDANRSGVFVVQARHGLLRGLQCDVDIEVTMPDTVALDADVGASTIRLAALRGNVRVKASTGRIEGTLATSDAELQVGTGKVDVVWTEAPTRGRVAFSVATGRMDLAFPKETVAKMAVRHGVGRFENQLRTDPQAAFVIEGKLGVGAARLTYRE
ncbi:MAG: hypothetical protein HY696_12365 [Deltaproteobacteria bacterium]|nr:hypothetical protein [Deltaproteobacteria bacterium]